MDFEVTSDYNLSLPATMKVALLLQARKKGYR